MLGAAGGSSAPLPDAVTLVRVNAQAGALYAQAWPVDAEPTLAQMEAISATERGDASVMKQWNQLKTSDLPALNRQLRGAALSEIQLQSNLHQEESQIDEE